MRWPAIAPLLAFALLAPASRADELLQKGATAPLRGTILSEDVDTVRFARDGDPAPIEFAANSIVEITYDDAPAAYLKGRELLAQGDARNAANSFRLALRSATKHDWIRVHGSYWLGVALQAWSATDATKRDEATATFARLLAESPACRFMPDALRRQADLLAAAKDAKGAAALYDRLALVARQRKLGADREARARLLKGDAFAAAGMELEAAASHSAAAAFAESSASTEGDPSIRRELRAIAGRARMAPGEVQLRYGQFAAARDLFERAAREPGAPPEVVAAATNGLGEVLLAEGRAREALEQFARVRVEHYLVREEAARATWFLGRSILALKNAEPNGKKKAADCFAEVIRRHADTRWADLARLEIRAPPAADPERSE